MENLTSISLSNNTVVKFYYGKPCRIIYIAHRHLVPHPIRKAWGTQFVQREMQPTTRNWSFWHRLTESKWNSIHFSLMNESPRETTSVLSFGFCFVMQLWATLSLGQIPRFVNEWRRRRRWRPPTKDGLMSSTWFIACPAIIIKSFKWWRKVCVFIIEIDWISP